MPNDSTIQIYRRGDVYRVGRQGRWFMHWERDHEGQVLEFDNLTAALEVRSKRQKLHESTARYHKDQWRLV